MHHGDHEIRPDSLYDVTVWTRDHGWIPDPDGDPADPLRDLGNTARRRLRQWGQVFQATPEAWPYLEVLRVRYLGEGWRCSCGALLWCEIDIEEHLDPSPRPPFHPSEFLDPKRALN